MLRQLAAVSISDVDVRSAQFSHRCAGELLRFGKAHKCCWDGERWSLAECGMDASDWRRVLEWAGNCQPSSFPGIRELEAGIMMLAVAAAVARTLDEEGLWSSVAGACSPFLRDRWFGNTDYLLNDCRVSLADACYELGIRQQLGMRGKHHYWRTVMLQFGFSAKAATRQLPTWLNGYNVPEVITTLLGTDENASTKFQEMWSLLERWSDNAANESIEQRLLDNCWYPSQSHALLKDAVMRERTQTRLTDAMRVEDQPANPTMFEQPRFSGEKFAIGLSRHLPAEFSSVRKPVSVSMGEVSAFKINRDEEGVLRPEGGKFCFPIQSVLRDPVREVKVFLPGGRIYRERVAFWDEDADLVVFYGAHGRRKEDLPANWAGVPCSLVVRGELLVAAGANSCQPDHRSLRWALYRFEHGLPPDLSVRSEEEIVWSPEMPSTSPAAQPSYGTLDIVEETLLRLKLRVAVPGEWECLRFRFAGRTFGGTNADMKAAPGLADWSGTPTAQVRQDGETVTAQLRTHVREPRSVGAAVQDESGEWHLMQSVAASRSAPVDGSFLDGRPLAFQWNCDPQLDVWLTLGSHALFPEPERVRLQRLDAMGESLQIRFGLMNEESDTRIEFGPMYSTGLLARVEDTGDAVWLHLREKMEAVESYRVSVWEREKSLPRTIDESKVDVIDGVIKVQRSSANGPIGWAISLDGSWRGFRFAKEPTHPEWDQISTAWYNVIDGTLDWEKTAKALCAWRFPVLVEPFSSIVRERVKGEPAKTLFAWTEENVVEGCTLKAVPNFYVAPLREMLWNTPIDRSAIKTCWSWHKDRLMTRLQERGPSLSLWPAAVMLLRANPVLLAAIFGEGLRLEYEEGRKALKTVQKTLFLRCYDSAAERDHRQKFLQNAQSVLGALKGAVGSDVSGKADDLKALKQEALSGLRSWSDNRPLDDHFFDRCIQDTAEALYNGAEALYNESEVESRQLKLAVARSPACCSYIAAHLFWKHMFLPLWKDEL